MKISDFLLILKECKYSAGYTSSPNFRVITDPTHTIWKIGKKEEKCSKCHHVLDDSDFLIITFEKPIDHLTVFECATLYMVFKEKKKPLDYAQWHKCIAGKRFIENISEVKI